MRSKPKARSQKQRLDKQVVESPKLRARSQKQRLDKQVVEPTKPEVLAPTILPDSEATPLLGLVMIVKNEAHGIAATLQSFRAFLDYWTILDTGSTDGTQEIIKRELAGVPGQLLEEPFVDFSTSRNRALDLHGQRTLFTIMPDSDDRLVNGVALRQHLIVNSGTASPAHEAYNLNIRRGNLSYYLPLILRSEARWRYVGRVHEFCARAGAPSASIRVPNVEVTQAPQEQSLAASKTRWERDCVLLEADRALDPKNGRTLFYLAQTYDCLGRLEDALATYEERMRVGGWAEETFESAFRRARVMRRLGHPWPDVQQALLEAHAKDPRRAEPLYEIADHYYYQHDNCPMTFLFARRAMELPLPESVLFVESEVYTWKAAHLTAISGFYLDAEAKRVGRRAADKATAGRGDDLIRSNRIFYVESAAQTFGTKSWRIPYEPAPPFVAANPSIHRDGDMWRCVVRTLNYKIINGTSYEPPDGTIRTRNMMLELDGNPADGFAIKKIAEMIDRDGTPRTDYPCHGFEDCRLFRVGSKLYCTATVCDFSTDVYGLREIVLCELDESDYGIVRATPLRGPWSANNQKNWMPLAASVDKTRIAYSLTPTTILSLSIFQEDHRYLLEGPDHLPLANPHLRGGSQLIAFDDGYLCLIHDVIFGNESRRTYLHRFVWLDDQFVIKKMSDLFYFEHKGVEYAAGLAVDADEKHLVASYSVGDSNANLAIFDAERVRQSLREDFAV